MKAERPGANDDNLEDYMKIDKKTLDMLSSLSDENLWRMICAIGTQSGFDLSGVRINQSDMGKLRDAMGKLTDADISRALEIFDSHNKQDR